MKTREEVDNDTIATELNISSETYFVDAPKHICIQKIFAQLS